ncbi:hypothetical protein MRX96_039590 [Rhipicephalus microplus]
MTSTTMALTLISEGTVGVDNSGDGTAAVLVAIPELHQILRSRRHRCDTSLSARRSHVRALSPGQHAVAIQVLDILNAAYTPAVIYLGLVGNVLSLLTFLCTKLRSRTSSLYIGALAVSDSGFLIILSFRLG